MRKLLAWVLFALLADPQMVLADELRKSGTGYFVDKDDDDTRDTDGTEPFVDFGVLEIPADYSTVQGALDSNDVKKGNTAGQGADIRLAPGSYGESFEIGGNVTTDYQNSIRIRGAGPGGLENSVGTDTCATTLIGDNTASNTVIEVDGAIGWGITDLCIDMDDAATNDPSIGIAIGARSDGTPPASDPVKHGVVENVTIHGGTSSSIGIKMGNDASNSDTAFNWIRNYHASQLGTALVINAEQTVGNVIENIQCRNPLGSTGCVSFGTEGGEAAILHPYMSSGAADQTGIEVRNEAIGPTRIVHPTFEWDEERGYMIRFWGGSPSTSTGAPRAHIIEGGRFQPQVAPNGTRYCVSYERVGSLYIKGSNFESSDDAWTCKINLSNPHAARPLYVTIENIMTKFGSEPEEMVFDRSTAGGPLIVTVINNGTVLTCTGTGNDETLTLANADCVGGSPSGSTAATPSVNDNDTSVATTAFVQAETAAAGDVTGTLGGGLTIGANSVALSTDTTGNYVATIADSGSSEVTVTGSGSEGAAVTLGLAAGITRDAELAAYTTGTSTPVDGSTACNTGDMHLETDAFKIYFCTDGSTDKWYGVALSDTP